jgi:hypothetical protein
MHRNVFSGLVRNGRLILIFLLSQSCLAHAQLEERGELSAEYAYSTLSFGSSRASFQGVRLALHHRLFSSLSLALSDEFLVGADSTTICTAKGCELVQRPHLNVIAAGVNFQGHSRVRPFAEAMVGGTHEGCVQICDGAIGLTFTEGAGIEPFVANSWLSWRIEGDFVQTHVFGNWRGGVELSTGPVFIFHKRH